MLYSGGSFYISDVLFILMLCILRNAFALPANETSPDSGPRIADVLDYMETHGGISWTDAGNGTRYTTHTYEEWASAERALIGANVETFIGALAANLNLPPDHLHASVSSASPSSPTPRSAVSKRDSGTRITGGLTVGGLNHYAYYYCFKSGQWGATSAFSDFVYTACNSVYNLGPSDKVLTWHSKGYHQPDHNVAAWFIQQSGSGALSASTCRQIFSGFQSGGVPSGAGPWCTGSGKIGEKDGPGMTQGGYVRWYANKDNSWFVGGQNGELRIDPNTCKSDGKPCSNIDNVANVQSNRLARRKIGK
ncbi:MAG: hypothetical protein Q9227_006121 [Pyrenula ochraceoflavens]